MTKPKTPTPPEPLEPEPAVDEVVQGWRDAGLKVEDVDDDEQAALSRG